jgi:hypothetical protein
MEHNKLLLPTDLWTLLRQHLPYHCDSNRRQRRGNVGGVGISGSEFLSDEEVRESEEKRLPYQILLKPMPLQNAK